MSYAKQRWSRREITNVEYTCPVNSGSHPTLQVDQPDGADVVVLCRLTGSGLEPFRLSLGHQVSTKVIEDELKAGTEQIVAVPVRSNEYRSLVRSYQVADVREVEAPITDRPKAPATEE